MNKLTNRAIDTVRLLSADAVQHANSGHPGMPMGAAPMGYLLYTELMRHNPQDPHWPNRDRFVLSAGHGCMLQYSLLYLTGYDLSLDDLKAFRQVGSKTPGHPEYDLTPGVEVTTGPLGQGFGNGVGLAIAQRQLAARYNRPDFPLFDYRIFAICSDGDLMEGISSEAGSLAGHLKLGNLIYLYDDNEISIEGDTDLAFSEDVAARFEAFRWHVQTVADGRDLDALRVAVRAAEADERPSLICVRTTIGYGSPNKAGLAAVHGSPLGPDELAATKEQLGWDKDKFFYVPDEVADHYREAGERTGAPQRTWQELYDRYREQYPGLAAEYERVSSGQLPDGWAKATPTYEAGKSVATRKASGDALNAFAPHFPALTGGAADLEPSTKTYLNGESDFTARQPGRNLRFGVREHAMGAVLNGMALTPGVRPYGATFLIFSDYMRPAIRLAAIMKINPIYVFTHDSIGLGEDGTTHQPIEQLPSLRAIPNVTVLRPADANETAHAWRVALQHTGGPVALVLTRQNVPVFDRAQMGPASDVEKGAYVLRDADTNPEAILIATGSEVSLALEAQARLAAGGVPTRVVSMPSRELFEKQSAEYRASVLPPELRRRVVVEAAASFGWERYATSDGVCLGIDRFGESGPYEELFEAYGFTVENVCRLVREVVGKTTVNE